MSEKEKVMIKAEHVTMRYLLADDRIQSLKESFHCFVEGKASV